MVAKLLLHGYSRAMFRVESSHACFSYNACMSDFTTCIENDA